VVADYQTTTHVEEALYRLVEVNMALGITTEAQATAAVLGHNFPNSPWYKNAYALLKSDGLSPQANSNSWIGTMIKNMAPGQKIKPQPAPEPVPERLPDDTPTASERGKPTVG
jgi:outer membrane protein assembly factor BamD